MPPAYGPTTAERETLALRDLENSDIFDPFLVYPSGSWPEAVVAGDYTADGRRDAVLVTSFDFNPAEDNRTHLFAQTAGGLLNHSQHLPAGSLPAAIASGDLNHDGRADVAVANQGSDNLGLFLQNGVGGLAAMIGHTAGDSPDGVTIGDFNGDLRDDVALSHAASQNIALYYQQADGSLAAPIYLGLSSGGYNDLAAGDLNGDGYDDLAVLRGAGHQSQQVAVLYQQNHALAAPIFRTAQDGSFLAHGLAVGDVTGDGRDDVVVTAGGNAPNAYLNVFAQQDDGSLSMAPTVYAAYHLPEAVEVGDVDHDGRNDIVLVHAGWMSLSVYHQNSSNTLDAYELYALPYTDFYRPAGLALADVSSDGGLDVLVASHSSLAAENGLVVLSNSGSAPTSTITIPAAGAFITQTTPYLIQGKASPDAVSLEISTDGGRTWQAQAAATTWSFNWPVPAEDGSHIILVRAINAAGQVQSPPAETRLIVDHTLPTGSLLINLNATYTNNPLTTLSVSGSDFNGVEAMRFANQGGEYSSWTPFAASTPWSLSGPDGVKTVSGQLRDVPGNVSSPFSDTIILDTTGPGCGLNINSGASYTTQSQVTLALNSSDANDVSHMRVRNAGGSWSAWQPYGTSLSWNIGSGDGSHTVEAQFRDVVGNESAVCSDAIILDTTAPSCAILINSGAAYSTQTAVSLTLSSSDANGVAQMRFSNNGSSWSGWTAYAVSYGWTLTSGDGPKTVYAQFRDTPGNSSNSCNDGITLDATPPTGFVIIASGATYTAVPTVTLTLGASDTYGVTEMRLSNNGSSWSAWQAYNTSAAWNLSAGDGTKTVYVQFKDTAGNVSASFTDTIILDSTAPGGAIVINNNASYTNLANITLSITATDAIPVTQMRLSEDAVNWTAWEAYSSSRSWTLSAGDGAKTVYVQFRDAVGNTSVALGDTIILDTAAPTCQLFIENNNPYETQTNVVLNVSCTDPNPPLSVRYSNNGSSWSTWESYTAVRNWTLTSGDGNKTVYLQAQDTAGNVSSAFTDTIILDTTAPSCTLTINGGAAYTTSLNVTLAIGCSDSNGLDSIRWSDNGTNWSAWQPYVTSLPYTLPAGDGVKTVYLQARDVPGNISSAVNDTIILDTILPSGGCSVQDDNGYVNNPAINLALWGSDTNGVPEMQVRNSGDAWGNWVSFSASLSWSLPGGDGSKTMECRFRDGAGNISPTYSATVILDTVQPSCSIQINDGAAYATDELVTLILSSSDSNGLGGMRFSHDAANWTGWEAYATSKSWTLLNGDGLKTVWVQFRDVADNVAQCNDTIVLDTQPPSGTISLAGGADFSPVTAITVTLSASDSGSGVSQLCLSGDGPPCITWQSYTPLLPWTLDTMEGTPQEVCAWFMDGAGNESAAACDTITLDTIAPTGSVIINGGVAYTNQAEVTLTINATDATSGVASMRLSANGSSWGSWQAYTTGWSWTFTGNDGSQAVYLQFRDNASNVSATYSDTIVLDRVAPAGTVAINGEDLYTNQANVTLTLAASDETSGVQQMRLSNDGQNWGSWLPYATTQAWTLSAGDGVKTVYVQFQDAAGNNSAADSDTIILDATAPTGSITINGGASQTGQSNVTLTLVAEGGSSGMCDIQVRNQGDAWGAWQPYTPTSPWTLTAGSGQRTVEARFRDCAGNESSVFTDSILVARGLYLPVIIHQDS